MEHRGRFAGKIALVTGAASGIGRATAILLAQEGARVAVTDVDGIGARAVSDAIAAAGGVALAHDLDVSSEAAWEAAMGAVERAWGPLDVLVNNAGIGGTKPIVESTLEDWRKVTAVNLDGVFLGVRAAIRSMRRTGRGSIVNVSSVAGIKATAVAAAYCASKAGVILLTKTAALECAKDGLAIRVNALAPGGVKTAIWKASGLLEEISKSPQWNAPPDAPATKRLAEPEEIARAIAFLASDEASYITGSVLTVDGGYTA